MGKSLAALLLAMVLAATAGATTRFSISSEGVITDSATGLEWVVGPDENKDYAQAKTWVKSCKIGGGGWRMPTHAELRGLYIKGLGGNNRDPLFHIPGWYIWAEPRDATSAWFFNFYEGYNDWRTRDHDFRFFGVRAGKK